MEIKGFALFWIVVFAAVPLMYLFQYVIGRENGFSLTVVLLNWLEILPYLILFCIHNFLLAPLFFKKKYWLYFTLSTTVFVAFAFYILATIIGPPAGANGAVEAPPGVQRPFSPEVMKVVIGILLILVNLGIKAMVLSAENERKVQELRAVSLAQQMEFLRYQINPHFFMNTLNNIQALVLTEPEKATECISEFSKLMRMVLSEGHTALIPLERELQFISHFVSLMRLQWPETVEISFESPERGGDAMVPALSMMSFVENAFKHGSKSKPGSFIRISVREEDGRVVFRCSNTLEAQNIREETVDGGVGISNVQSRLALIYNKDFTLKCGAEDGVYNVLMSIPAIAEGGVL
ncbi:MAG: histidine kinase [Bacteroidales bacterium]|nr:histidine kinase [Bacteroidales bacterium]